MPIQRRMPTVGFLSKILVAEVRLDELLKVEGASIDIEALKKANLIPTFADRAKVVLSGEITKAVNLKGIGATKGAKEAIEKAGGSVEALPEPPKPSKLAPKKQA
jgi:large subunit ribosomal protein L15